VFPPQNKVDRVFTAVGEMEAPFPPQPPPNRSGNSYAQHRLRAEEETRERERERKSDVNSRAFRERRLIGGGVQRDPEGSGGMRALDSWIAPSILLSIRR